MKAVMAAALKQEASAGLSAVVLGKPRLLSPNSKASVRRKKKPRRTEPLQPIEQLDNAARVPVPPAEPTASRKSENAPAVKPPVVKRKRKRASAKTPKKAKDWFQPVRKAKSERPLEKVNPGEKTFIRIGIILTSPKSEAIKEELLSLKHRKRPWTREVTDKRHVTLKKYWKGELRREYNKYTKSKKPEDPAVPGDVSIGQYILWKNEEYDIEVDFILPKELSVERCNQNDINFLIIYDLLEAFHIDKSKKTFNAFNKVLNECNNIYPNREYQQFINSKIEYYEHFGKVGVNIAATKTLTTEQYKERYPEGAAQCAKDLMQQILDEKWEAFYAKPVYGQESKDAKKFVVDFGDTSRSHGEEYYQKKVDKEEARFVKYLDKVMNKYPGCVFQKYIKNFGHKKSCPEIRMYYCGDDYQFSVCATNRSYMRPREEGGKHDFPMERLKQSAEKILEKLPKIEVNGKILPRLLTRCDMGFKIDGEMVDPYVNEVEFVPSLYIDEHPFLIDQTLGDQMVDIACMFTGVSKDQLKKQPQNGDTSA